MNRERLRALLEPRSLVVVNANDIPPTNADGTMTPVANSDLFYLTGVEQEQTILLLAPDALDEKAREILFVRETSELLAQWEGHKLTKEEARAASGIARVEWLDQFPRLFPQLMSEMENVWLNSNDHARAVIEVESRDARFVRETQRQWPLHQYRRLARLMRTIRLVKSEHELALLRRACAITAGSFDRVARMLRPGVNECEVEAEFAHEYIRQRARFSYQPIIASGKNACVLHYVANDQPCKNGELLLLDVGASYRNYNADVTRTLPVNGKFSRRQKQVYEAVLRVLRQCTDALTPAERLQAKQGRGVVHVVEHEGRGLIDRGRPCAGGWIGAGAGMDRQGSEAVISCFRHGAVSLERGVVQAARLTTTSNAGFWLMVWNTTQ